MEHFNKHRERISFTKGNYKLLATYKMHSHFIVKCQQYFCGFFFSLKLAPKSAKSVEKFCSPYSSKIATENHVLSAGSSG